MFVILTGIFGLLDVHTAAAPYGVISYELAGDAERAAAILSEWGEVGRLRAAFCLGLDYLYLLAYAEALALAARWAGGRRGLDAAGRWVGRGAWLAAACDAIENAALLSGLLAGPTDRSAWLAAGFAAVKFALVGVALLFAAVGLPRPR